MPIGIKELSEKLKVSPATISRVINGGANVRPETYQRVMEGIREYDYIPNEAARDLKSRNSTTVGVVIPDLGNVFFTSIVSGIEGYLNDLGYSIILCNYNEDYDLQIRSTRMLLSRNIAGLIIAPTGRCRPYYRSYEDMGVPVVFIDSYPYDMPDCNCVMIDNAAAARTLCDHMLDMYGGDLMLLSTLEGDRASKNHHSATHVRLNAALEAFGERGLTPRENWVQITEKSSFDSGYRAVADFLLAGNRPRGILATSNYIAYGAIAAIQDRGLVAPDDIGVACFDAVDTTRLVRPRITSITQPTVQMGMLAAQLVYGKLKARNKLQLPDQKIIVEPEFMIRESCGHGLRKSSV